VTHRAFYKYPPGTPSRWRMWWWHYGWVTTHILLGIAVVLVGLLLTGCASRNFNHIEPKPPSIARQNWVDKQTWRGVCHPARVKRAREILLLGHGRPYVALYFLRCTPRDDWVGVLVPRRARRKMR
jgi:hypothetical protein